MWLQTSYDCYNGSYSWFNSFRNWIFKNIWLDMDEYIWFNSEWTKSLLDIGHPIAPLLNHSDCSGTLNTQEQESIILWWNQILSNLLEKDEFYEKRLRQFIEWCKLAIEKWDIIYFY